MIRDRAELEIVREVLAFVRTIATGIDQAAAADHNRVVGRDMQRIDVWPGDEYLRAFSSQYLGNDGCDEIVADIAHLRSPNEQHAWTWNRGRRSAASF